MVEIRKELVQDPKLKVILAYFSANPALAPANVQKMWRDYQLEDGLQYYKNRVYVSDISRVKKMLLKLYHNSPLAGHAE